MKKRERPFLAVRAIIKNESDRILILKRDATAYGDEEWCLPGGKIDFGQMAVEAVANEVMEETFLKCTDIEFLFYQDSLPDQNLELHFVNLVFLCKVIGTIKLNAESSDYAWVGSEDIGNYKMAFNNGKILSQYLNI